MFCFLAALSAKDFLNNNKSAVEQRVSELAITIFQQKSSIMDKSGGETAGIVIAAIVVVFLIITVAITVTVIGFFVYSWTRQKRR